MKRAFIAAVWLMFTPLILWGQTLQVPSRMECAGIELHFTEALRKDLQAEVDALAASPKYFQVKLERARQYFPIIERIFREENVPDDIKYLAMQESALIADAVSSSNAVGFWQMKEPAAGEVGLTINRNVDERMNIVSATRGAARYLKANNFYFNNWIYAILSYNTGRSGAEQYVDRRYFGARKMELGKTTYWYVKKFLAHKIVFENELQNHETASVILSEYDKGAGKTLNQIAREFNVQPDDLALYNKWLRSGRIPDDKTYAVIIPGTRHQDQLVAAASETAGSRTAEPDPSPNRSEYPLIKEKKDDESRLVKINGIPGIIAGRNDNISGLAGLGSVPVRKFLKVNDMDISTRIIPGEVYYFRTKHNKAREYFHTVQPGQTLWEISQKYGIKLKKLLSKNRLESEGDIKPGMVLWIRYIRPADKAVQYVPVHQIRETEIAATDEIRKPLKNNSDSVIQVPAEDTLTVKQTRIPGGTGMNDSVKSPAVSFTGSSQLDVAESAPDSDLTVKPLFHVVKKGETLYGISKMYAIPLDTLEALNEISEDDGIKIGQQLYLREPPREITITVEKIENSTESYISYEVLKGDTMYSIARKFNVTVGELQQWNNKDSFDLKTGEILKIHKRL